MAKQTSKPMLVYNPPQQLNRTEHTQRIKDELRSVGVSKYGQSKFAVRYLPRIIYPDEHIVGAVYGRSGTDGFFKRLNEVMFVATDRRIILVDRKPGFADVKEFTYDVLSGIERITAGFSSAVTLFTKIGNFNIHNANPKCVETFTAYVEARRLELVGVSRK